VTSRCLLTARILREIFRSDFFRIDLDAWGRCLEGIVLGFGGVDRLWMEFSVAQTTERVEGPGAGYLFSLSFSPLCDELGGVSSVIFVIMKVLVGLDDGGTGREVEGAEDQESEERTISKRVTLA